MSQSNGHRDVIIRAVPAVAKGPGAMVLPPSPEEIIQFQAARIRELEADVSAKTTAASTIANAAINLLDLLVELGYGSRDGGVVIEKNTWEKTRGLQLTVSGDDKTGKVVVRAREKEKPAPLAFEDRQD